MNHFAEVKRKENYILDVLIGDQTSYSLDFICEVLFLKITLRLARKLNYLYYEKTYPGKNFLLWCCVKINAMMVFVRF